jgi:hypothetical protein
MQVAEVVASLVPDRNVDDLRAIDHFLTDLSERRTGVTELNVLQVNFSFPLSALSSNRTLIGPRLLVQRAAVLGRLGDDVKALELAKRALAQCPNCVTVVTMSALIHARAGYYEQAMALLEQGKRLTNEAGIRLMQAQLQKAWNAHRESLTTTGPAQLQKRAAELLALDLYGRAYEVLAPHKDEIKLAPAFAPRFAEIAFRAGETAIAREVMATYARPDEIEPQLQEWAVTMGWGD